MSKLTDKIVVAKLKDAIDKLEEYQSKEPAKKKRKEASELISELRNKIIEKSWNNIIERTTVLTELKDQLTTIIDSASDTTTVGGVIEEISLLVADISELINEE
jgi:hypothetical protein